MNGPFKIVKRPTTGNYTLRFYVPLRYQTAFGKREIWKSLGTPDRNKAKELAPAVVSEIMEQIKAVCEGPKVEPSATIVEPTREQIDQAVRWVYAAEVQSDQDELTDVSSSYERGTAESASEYRRHSMEIMRASLRGDYSATAEDFWREEFNFTFKPGSPRESEYKQQMARAYSEAAKRWAEHDEFTFGRESENPQFKGIIVASSDDRSMPKHPLELDGLTEPQSAPLKGAHGRPAAWSSKATLGALWASYERQRCAGVVASTKIDKQRMVKLFSDYVGASRSADTITKEEARNWRDALFEMPRSAAQKNVFRGKTMREVIELNKQVGHKTLSPESINKHISMVSTFFEWAVDEGHTNENVMNGLKISAVRKGSKRATFSVAQMQRLFDTPWFTGCVSDHDIRTRMRPGPFLLRNWRYWIPLLAAFTGARQGELLQLEVSDVREKDGVQFLAITDEGEASEKAVKTTHSRRSVPIHSQLKQLGFLEYVAAQRLNGHTRLFPELTRSSTGYFNYAQKELGKLIDHMKFPTDTNGNPVVFHSFRHAVADEFRRRFTETDFQPLLGHKQHGVTRGYGVAEDLGLARRQEIIEEIRYPGLNLTRLTLAAK